MLYLVTHADSELGSNLHHGDLDPPISAKGVSQLEPVIERLRNKGLDLIVTPSVERNTSTAALLGSALGVHIFVDEGLRTWRQGVFSGWPHDKAEAAIKVYLKHPNVRVPQGESANQFLKRLARSFKKYDGMSRLGRLNIALVLNSLSINAVAGRFKTLAMDFNSEDADVYEVGPMLKLKELR